MASENFNQLLNVFWLRPETALWRHLDIEAMRDFKFFGRSLDFGCGDGLFSFIRAGGEFDPLFDAFQKTANLDRFYQKVDVFDAYDDSYAPLVEKRPDYQISVGFDHKPNLLKKAAGLGLYAETVVGDGNEALAFKDESFDTIFSNIVYWLNDPATAIAELCRILQPGGQICLMLPNATLPEYSFFNRLFVQTKDPAWSWLDELDRGRLSDNIKQAASDEQWREIFGSAGLTVHSHSQHLSKHIIQAWDIGFRPMFPAFLKAVEAIPADKLADVKVEWVESLRRFAVPFAATEIRDNPANAFHCYILTK
ncbi:class I SAM-dependent methyltransferase [Rhizobium leguminosarum]|uniref:class I SAM-dependent methyltransferase n=1 Tax=Rhizobium leguminosarum TaxID=384 RepID=UPI001C9182CE|nr:class I SAM-dependent methyltransferase [Rhizobium leguminosarum]MBY2918847.1 class I SAM-dependent methyltransferase [Rhizobium leguminosarum]MBY2974558.1 class I SAM-dependent methyltransferase [Rhizobium leguminosarum]MBY2981977.1 class I SAM-dependent methyltransferase [Rhizobium leguminosarum]MBY3010507.1 class I SAM-dependent methyltransferase [Rhizobium leguminosarum]